MKTMKHVPIMKTGEYDLSTGPASFTTADLASAVSALADPGVHDARLAIGHLDGRFDGEPAFGKVVNCSLEDEGHTLYGDITGIPDWLYEIMPVAFPNRSIEGEWNYQSQVGATAHRFVLTRLSLLGVQLPGISTLEDLEIAFTGEPEYELLDDLEDDYVFASSTVAAFKDGEPMPKKKVAAAFNVDDVRRAFYNQVATGDRTWWWAREIMIDPMQVIVFDEDEGDTYRVPYTADAKGTVTFTDPVEVNVVYVDETTEDESPALLAMGSGTVYATEAESRPKERKRMTPKKIRAALGLPADATEEEVEARAKHLASLEEPDDDDDDPAATDDDDDDDDAAAEGEEDDDDEPVPAVTAKKNKSRRVKVPKASAPKPEPVKPPKLQGGTVTVDAAAWTALNESVANLTKVHTKSEKQRREEVVDAAVKAGKIPPARKEFWVKAMEADPEGIEEQLDGLEEIIPVTMRGTAEHDADDDQVFASDSATDQFLTPAELRRRASATAGETSRFLEPGTIARER